MAASRISYPGDGETTQFAVPFGYLSPDHIFVSRNGILQNAADFSLSGSTVTMAAAPLQGDILEIFRETSPSVRLVDYTPGAQLAEADLDTDSIQAFYLAQENRDLVDGVVTQALRNLAAGLGNSPDPSGTAQEILDAVVQDVLNSALLADLQQRISDIDLNAESILDQDDRLVDLQATVDQLSGGGNVAALIAAEETARVNGDNALAQTIALIGAVNGNGSAFIVDASTAEISPGEALADRLTGLRSDIDDNVAAIALETTARSNGDSANAAAITALSARVDGNEAAVAVTASVAASAANGVTELEAQYTVKVDVNGYVAGYGLAATEVNGVPFSEFIVLADRFAVVTPGISPVVPFVVTGGAVHMQNVVIGDALIDEVSAGKITAGNITANIGISTGSLNITSSGKIYSGKTTFASTTSGWFLGRDGGVPKFKIGDANNWMEWDGTTLKISGALLVNVDSVTIPDTAIQAFNVNPGHAITRLRLADDRTLRSTETPNGFTDADFWQWLGNGHPSFYECRMSPISGTFTSGPVNTWVSCDTNPTWEVSVTSGSPGTKFTIGDLTVRRKADQRLLDTGRFTFNAQVS